MDRRRFLSSAAFSVAAIALAEQGKAQDKPTSSRTRWQVGSSEGLDAIAFLGPLSGGELYTRYYAEDSAALAPNLPAHLQAEIKSLYAEAEKANFGLLAPGLCVIFSAEGAHNTLESVLVALKTRETSLLPAYRASPYWDAKSWGWFESVAGRLQVVFQALRDAHFDRFRAARIGNIDQRAVEVQRSLARYDVIKWQEKLTGRKFDPVINILLLQFAKPHGIKVQGQTFLQAADYESSTTVRIAAHEMLHPPVDMKGEAALAALKVFSRDPLMRRIVQEHDPKWGYTTLDGLLDEDICEALDQLISEALGVAKNPADRWNNADDGIHVIAAGLYGLFRRDRWVQTGGSLERWLLDAARRGRLSSPAFHKVAAQVLEKDVNRLWPLG